MQEKGITLVSLTVYVVGFSIVIGIVAVILSFIQKNVIEMGETTDTVAEYSNFNLAFVEDMKTPGNDVTEVTDSKVVFSNGNQYTFQQGKIYKNKAMISNYVKSCHFSLNTVDYKKIVTVQITIGKGQTITKNIDYVLTTNE